MRRISVGIATITATVVICLPGCGERQMPFEAEVVEAPRPFFSQEPAPGFDVVRRTRPLRRDLRRSAFIGPKGGTIKIWRAGVALVIPRGALAARTRITVTATRGDAVAFVFAPHGLQFEQPATLRVRLEGTTAYGTSSVGSLLGVYFMGDGGGAVVPLETYPTSLYGPEVRWTLDHFSGHALAGG